MAATRRAMFALPALAAASAAVGGPKSPDAALLSLCERWHRANEETLRLDALCRAYPSDREAEEAWTASLDATDVLEERMLPIRPATLAGLIAKASVFQAAIMSSRIVGEALNWDEELADAILRDVLGLRRTLGVAL